MNLPEYIDNELWAEFVKMRKAARRIPFTDYAQKLILNKLQRFHEWGYDPNESLRVSIERGWAGVFEQGEPNREAQRTWKPARVNYSAADREYYNSFYKQHPDLMPEGWKQ